jgi:enterochelin esterase-like enzyme
MRLRPSSIVLVALAGAALLCTLPAQRPDRRNQPPVELKHFAFQTKTFDATSIGSETQYGIYLPKDYDAEANKATQWPLVIWLHGMFEDHLRFHGRGGAPVLDKAVEDGVLPPCVFVLANGGRTSLYVNRGKGADYEDLITKDLLDHIALNYRVRQDRESRALMGISMGGMAALRIAFTKPQLFGTVAVHSSAVFAKDPEQLPERIKQFAKRLELDKVFGDPIDKAKWAATNPLSIANELEPKQLDGLRLYLDAGTEDRYGFDQGNAALHELLEQKKVRHDWRLVEGGGHAWGDKFQEKTLEGSLAFVGQAFAATAAKEKGLQGLGGLLGGDKDEKGGGKAPSPEGKQQDGGK